MSHVYPTLKSLVWDSILNGAAPQGSGPTFRAIAVGLGYSYNPLHSVFADLGGAGMGDAGPLTTVTHVNGLIKADNINLSGLTIGATMKGIVVYLSWVGGTQLCAYIDQGIDFDFPYVFDEAQFIVRWNPAGIFQL